MRGHQKEKLFKKIKQQMCLLRVWLGNLNSQSHCHGECFFPFGREISGRRTGHTICPGNSLPGFLDALIDACPGSHPPVTTDGDRFEAFKENTFL